MSEHKRGVVYADGACIGNPGPAGAGYVITDPGGNLVTQGAVALGRGTNNIAEYQGVIAGLEAAARLGFTDLTVRSDSELLCKQMQGQYRVKDATLKRLHARVRALMRSFQSVRFEHIPREMNSLADRLSGEAARQAGADPSKTQLQLDV